MDIRDEKQVADSVQKAVAEFGGIDIGKETNKFNNFIVPIF